MLPRATIAGSSLAAEEMVGLDGAPKPLAQLRRKTQRRGKRAMMNRNVRDQTFLIFRPTRSPNSTLST
jgi:hypothetical protein